MTLTQLAASQDYGSAVAGSVLVVGTSLEQNEGSDWPYNNIARLTGANTVLASPNGPLQWASALNGARLRIVRNAAVSGQTSDLQLAGMTNPNSALYVLGLSPAPGLIYFGFVEGDDTAPLTAAQSAANVTAIFALLRRAYPSAAIIIPTLPGVNIPAGGNATLRAATNPVRRQLALQPNTILFEFEAVYTNPLTGLPIVALSQDQVHPNPRGAMVIGQALGPLITPRLSDRSLVNDYSNDPRVSVGNGGWTNDAMMQGVVGANTTATNWTFAGPLGGARNLIARTDQYVNFQEMVYGGTAGALLLSHGMPVLPAGAIAQLEAELQFEGNLPVGTITDISLMLLIGNAGFANIGTAAALGNGLDAQGLYLDPGNGVTLTLRTPPLVIPAGMFAAASGAQLRVNGTAVAGGLKVGRCSQVRVS